MCQNRIFIIPLIFYVFIRGIVFIKWEQNHRSPDETYINNNSINAVVLNLIIP